MTNIRSGLVVALLSFLIFSCSKEESADNGGNPGGGGQPPIGTNCKVNQVIAADSATGRGLLSIFTAFNTAGLGTSVRVYDSTNGTVPFESTLQYIGDTIRISPTDYFLRDGSGRVAKFVTVEDFGSGPEEASITYQYDASGYLAKREISIASIPIPFIRFAYTWSGQNLAAVSGDVIVPGFEQKVLTAQLEYDATLTAKNLFPIFPDGFETSFYIMALNLGKASKNLVKKITLNTYDENGNLDQTFVTNISKYVFSSDGYLTEWYAQGDDISGAGIPAGRSQFKYFCP
jgi:hypothetical protein